MTDTRLLNLDDVAFAYDGEVALDHVTMHIDPGQAVALIGPNGSGKSTMLKGVLGVIPLVDGEMTVFRPKKGRGQSGRIGYLPQDDEIDADFPITLRQVVTMGRYRRLGWFRFPSADDRQAVADALEVTGLTSRANQRFGTLSGGQQQRGLLARALATKPSLLLLDEPSLGLAPLVVEQIFQTINALRHRLGLTIVLVEQNASSALAVADEGIVLNLGRVVAQAPARELLADESLRHTYLGY